MNKKYKTLMRRWESTCVLCGERIDDENSVTREHLIPRSKGGNNGSENIAISHFKCNQIRGDLSLIEIAILMEMRKAQMGDRFSEYVNQPVPNRFPYEEPGNPLYGTRPSKAKNKKSEMEQDNGRK